MLAFKELHCTYLLDIQKELYSIICNNSDMKIEGWQFLDKKLLRYSPSTIKYLKSLNLAVEDFSITILNNNLVQHVDSLPHVAKINIPISNTDGWSNIWYSISHEQLKNAPQREYFGLMHEDVTNLDLPELARVDNLKKIVVFNSRIPHAVIKNNPSNLPRIVASLTFKNQPMEMLDEDSNNRT